MKLIVFFVTCSMIFITIQASDEKITAPRLESFDYILNYPEKHKNTPEGLAQIVKYGNHTLDQYGQTVQGKQVRISSKQQHPQFNWNLYAVKLIHSKHHNPEKNPARAGLLYTILKNRPELLKLNSIKNDLHCSAWLNLRYCAGHDAVQAIQEYEKFKKGDLSYFDKNYWLAPNEAQYKAKIMNEINKIPKEVLDDYKNLDQEHPIMIFLKKEQPSEEEEEEEYDIITPEEQQEIRNVERNQY